VSRLAAVLLAALLVGCGCETRVEEPPPEAAPVGRRRAPTPEQQVAARRVIAAWLHCEECIDGELNALVQLGAPLAEPTLASTLLGGPSPASLALRQAELRARYPELVEFARSHPHAPVGMDLEQHVTTYLANFVALQRIRSAQGLAALGGPGAVSALRKAQGLSLRQDVRQAVDEALAQLASP
jgi:hypothetical protein